MLKEKFKAFCVELLPTDYAKLEELVNSGKYRTKIDAIRSWIRKEILLNERSNRR